MTTLPRLHQNDLETRDTVLPQYGLSSKSVVRKKPETSIFTMPELIKKLPASVLCDYQKILENIFSFRAEAKCQIIGVTSAHTGEGTSTTIAVLSLLSAVQPCFFFKTQNSINDTTRQQRVGKNGRSQNILLIDTQIKHPTLHRMFGVDAHPGLIDFIHKKENINASLRQIGSSRLKLLPAGTWTDESHHLYSDVFLTLLEQVRNYVYFVFMDIPPLLEYAEAITLCKLCDGVILNVKSAQTRLNAVQEAVKLLEKSHSPILGTILNDRKMYVPHWISSRL